MNLEEYFCEAPSLKCKIKRMWYFKFRYHLLVMVHIGLCDSKKGKDKLDFDSYRVHPPNELNAYLRSPIFYNSERVQQNGEVFFGHYVSSH